MNRIMRNKILIRYMVESGIVRNQKELGEKMGYSNESAFSQVINERVAAPKGFISKLKTLIPQLNEDWLLYGEGEMIVPSTKSVEENISVPQTIMSSAVSQRVSEVVKYLIFSNKATDKADLAQKLGYNVSSFSQIINGRVPISHKFMEKISTFAPEINDRWVLTGDGDMLINESPLSSTQNINNYIPMLPLLAIGGSLSGFDDSATLDKCERVLSPIKDVDFAMEVYGDSMAPEYPSGSRIFIKKIDYSAFIEWGKVYVLDTINGTIVKEVFPQGEQTIECRSINPLYPPFSVNLKDVRGMYRVLMSMSMK